MPAPTPFLQEAHLNTIRTSAPIYMKGYSDLTTRNHMLLNMMKQWGNILYNANGWARQWQIAVYEHQVRTFANTTNKTFVDHTAFEQLQVDTRGYEATDLLKELEFKENSGEQQLVNLYEFKLRSLATAITRRIQEWLYRDGDSAEYQDGFLGFESCLGALNSGNGGSDATANDRIVLPNDTYGGHSTKLGNFGGSWSADLPAANRLNQSQGLNNDWPYGIGPSEYGAISPALWNYESTKWSSGVGSWESNVEEVVRNAAMVLRNRNGMGMGDIDLCFLLAPDLYPGAENYYSSRFRIIQPYSGGDQGFPIPNSMYIDGVALKSDYGCPAGIGYGICPAHTELFFYETMNPAPGDTEPMIDSFGPQWSPEHGAYLYRATVFGNMRLQPRYISKLAGTAHYAA